MTRVAIAAVGLLLCAQAAAAKDWLEVGHFAPGKPNASRIYIDRGSVARVDERVRFWTRVVFDEPKPGPSAGVLVGAIESQLEVDCGTETAKHLQSAMHDTNGELLVNLSGRLGFMGNPPDQFARMVCVWSH